MRADATTNPELFWAVRGGGGNFGVVTALEFRMFAIETAYAGHADVGPRRTPSRCCARGRVGAGRAGRGHHVVPA